MMLITQLDFAYGDRTIFDGARIELPERGVVALRGSNGIGKTTLLKLLGGLLPTRNRSVLELRTQRRAVYLDADFLSLDSLTTREYLSLMAVELGTGDAVSSRLLDPSALDTRVVDLSLGQRQRCVLALALHLRDVDLLLLDEPLNGLDSAAGAAAREELVRAGTRATLLIATHERETWTDYDMRIADTDSVLVHPIARTPAES